MDAATKAKSVKIGQKGHEGVVGLKQFWDEVFGAEGLGVEIEVRKNDAFGFAGGAARIHDDGTVVWIDSGVGVTDETIGLHEKTIPSNDVLGCFDVIFAAFGKFVNNTHQASHGTRRRNYD